MALYDCRNSLMLLVVHLLMVLPYIVYIIIMSRVYCANIHTLFRFGSAIVAEQPRTLPFLVQAPYNPHCFLTYSNRSTVPQDQEVDTCICTYLYIFHGSMFLVGQIIIFIGPSNDIHFSLSSGIPLLHQQHCTSGISPLPPVH